MMVTTHALIAGALASTMVFIAPEYAYTAVVAALVGGFVPDLDMPFNHRRTFHFPVYFSVLALFGVIGILVAPSTVSIVVGWFLIGAAVHSVSDIVSGDLGLRPWEMNDDRSVYIHYLGRYAKPRRWVRYDGSPEDFVLAVFFAVPIIALFDDALVQVVAGLLGVSFIYMLVRKKIVEYAPERFK